MNKKEFLSKKTLNYKTNTRLVEGIKTITISSIIMICSITLFSVTGLLLKKYLFNFGWLLYSSVLLGIGLGLLIDYVIMVKYFKNETKMNG